MSGLEPTGTQILAFTPNILDASAIDWPWFPVEAVITPLSRSSGLRLEMRFMPPLILNTPVGWTFSCFT